MHLCTPDDPYSYVRHGYTATHPDSEYIRDSIEPRGGKVMAIYRCRVCGTRWQGDAPAPPETDTPPPPAEEVFVKARARSVAIRYSMEALDDQE